MEVLRHLIEGDDQGVRARSDASLLTPDRLKEMGLSGRETREFVEKLKPREVPDFELDLSTMRRAEDVAARDGGGGPWNL